MVNAGTEKFENDISFGLDVNDAVECFLDLKLKKYC